MTNRQWKTLTIFTFITSLLRTTYPVPFPAARFFNVSHVNVTSISKYLCYENPREKKCCSCDSSNFSENWCIDILWEKDIYQNLTEYLQILVAKVKSLYGDSELTCQPVFYPLVDGHKSEHIPMVFDYLDDDDSGTHDGHYLMRFSYFNNNYREMVDCLDAQDNMTQIPVYDKKWNMLYVNKRCADFDSGARYTGLNISVQCKTITNNIHQNQVFSSDLLKNEDQCVFHYTRSNAMTYYIPEYDCPVERTYCPRKHAYFYLCKAYYAPTRGYKNYHCYQCQKNTTETSFPLDICPDRCKEGICPLNVSSGDYPDTFDLVADGETEFIVKNINRPFPVMEFLGLSKANISNGNTAFSYALGLCDEDDTKSCCVCDHNCMKFTSCCMDALWKKSHPVSVVEYRQLLINTSRRYKDHECVKLFPGAHHNESKMYFMVSACPRGADKHSKQKCDDVTNRLFQSYVPVIGDDQYLYRNFFCAQCHSVKRFEPVNITADCVITDSKQNSTTHCIFAIHEELRWPEIINQCKSPMSWNRKCEEGNKFYDLCNAYKGPLKYFSNIHCYMCKFHVHSMPLPPLLMCPVGVSPLTPWSMLFSFSSNGELSNIRLKNGTHVDICDRGNIFSITKTKCQINDNVSDLDTWLTKIKNLHIYSSYVGTSISVICYLIILWIFGSFQHLRKVPGMLIMGLVCSLLSGDVLFLLNGILEGTGYNKIEELCKTVAVLTHFCLTMAHIWNVIIAYNVMARFTTFTPRMIHDDSTTPRNYCIIAFVITLLIVITSFVLDQLEFVMIGYGADDVCTPRQFYGRLLFYIIPVIISFITSLGFVIRAVYKVSKESKSNNQALGNSRRNKLNVIFLALKLTLLLGISEGIGVVQIIQSHITEAGSKHNATLGLLYSFCKSIRGVLIVVVYICRRDVFRLYVEMRGSRSGRSNTVGNPTDTVHTHIGRSKNDSTTLGHDDTKHQNQEESSL